MNGYVHNSNDSASPNYITYYGLVPDSIYDLYIYTQAGSGGNGWTLSVSIDGGSLITTDPIPENTNSFIENKNYLHLSGKVLPTGQLEIAYSAGNGEGDINGMQLLYAVPEVTSSFTMLGLISSGLLLRRRSKHLR
jgi:hypothetical protein